MPVVIVPPPYRGPTRGTGEVKVEPGTARACLEAVEREHPGFLALVMDGSGRVHRFARLFLNGDPLDDEQLDTALGVDDRLEIVAAIAGG